MSEFQTSLLRPGDCILYRPADVFDVAVAIKTFTWTSHVEIYSGDGMSVASRNGQGVNLYNLRTDHVAAVLRPGPGFKMDKAMNWFYAKARGQKYGWRTLLSFVLLNSNPIEGHMICSEFATNWYVAGDYPLFSAIWPAYRTPPATLLTTRQLAPIWDDGKLFKSL